MSLDSLDPGLPSGVDSRSDRSWRATRAGKIDIVAGGLSAQDRVAYVTGIGVNVGTERFQNVDGVFRVVDRVGNLGVAESEIFPDVRKFFGKIIVPSCSTGTIRWKIGFAHRCHAPAHRCTGFDGGASIRKK